MSFIVFVSQDEISEFRNNWPASNLPTDGGIRFEFDKKDGDLVDITLTNGDDSDQHDGVALHALSRDAQELTVGKEVFPRGEIMRDAIAKSEFLGAYIEAMFFTDGAEDGHELYGKTIPDMSFDFVTRTIKDCAIFETAHERDIDGNAKQAGHDFWLTRNGHGAGFWDGDWSEDAGKYMTDTSKAFGEVDVYVGDDGLIYC